jgi:hypothetical protein
MHRLQANGEIVVLLLGKGKNNAGLNLGGEGYLALVAAADVTVATCTATDRVKDRASCILGGGLGVEALCELVPTTLEEAGLHL